MLKNGLFPVLDTTQNVRFELLKLHHGGPRELAALPSGGGEIILVMDPEPKQSMEEIPVDHS